MSAQEVRVSQIGAVCHLQLNRPTLKNAISMHGYQLLIDAIEAADANDAVRSLVLSGVEGNFTSGNDLSEFASGDTQLSEDMPTIRFMQALMDCRKPVIAAVNGVAVGIGSTLLLHCDLVYADRSARFSLPFNSLGLCAEFGSSYLLPKMMGRAQAMELILFGEVFDGAKAKELGIVVDVVENVIDHALARAKRLAELPPVSTRLNKRLLRQGGQQELRQVITDEAQDFALALKGPEFLEAVSAFLEKRAPDFSNVK